jgi:hypothetical protein
VHGVAKAERLLALAWLRSGDEIRRLAPRDVAGRWRAEAIAAGELARRQLVLLAEVSERSALLDIPIAVLKGVPLSHQLYGDIGARSCCDIDVYVPPEARARAHQMLGAMGWTHWWGEAPFDASYRRESSGATIFLEVHSVLASEALAHCPLVPPLGRVWRYDDVVTRTLDSPALAVYLGANICKHAMASLLSFVDLAAVWDAYDGAARANARRLAKDARLTRCFRWALSRAEAISPAAGGDAQSLRRLGIRDTGRKSSHALLRLIWLSDRPSDAARILATWTWPRSLRRSRGGMGPFWKHRMSRSFKNRFAYARSYAVSSGSRS